MRCEKIYPKNWLLQKLVTPKKKVTPKILAYFITRGGLLLHLGKMAYFIVWGFINAIPTLNHPFGGTPIVGHPHLKVYQKESQNMVLPGARGQQRRQSEAVGTGIPRPTLFILRLGKTGDVCCELCLICWKFNLETTIDMHRQPLYSWSVLAGMTILHSKFDCGGCGNQSKLEMQTS